MYFEGNVQGKYVGEKERTQDGMQSGGPWSSQRSSLEFNFNTRSQSCMEFGRWGSVGNAGDGERE